MNEIEKVSRLGLTKVCKGGIHAAGEPVPKDEYYRGDVQISEEEARNLCQQAGLSMKYIPTMIME